MIIHQVKLTNFGIYGGTQEFDLTPIPTGNFYRPIVLFRGKNGVGKTTFVEAIRLCLHGSLVLGNRVKQREFDNYLSQRIHHHANDAYQPTAASVDMLFEYVDVGQKTTYRVLRAWEQSGSKLIKGVSIWENGTELSDLDADEKEQFLRELAPPGVIDLFFFDGEKIQTLAEDNESSNFLLAQTIKTLLGLDIVELLSKDLDIYISRQGSYGDIAHLQKELQELSQRQEVIEQQLEEFQAQQRHIETQIREKNEVITAQEQKFAIEGGQFAGRREELQNLQQQLQAQIETYRRQIQESCGGLMPFAITPKMLKAVAKRLELEDEYKQEQAAQRVIKNRLKQLETKLASETFWAVLDGSTQKALLEEIIAGLLPASFVGISPDEIIMQVSDAEHRTMLEWINQALNEVPRQFSQLTWQLNSLEAKLEEVKEELGRIPANTLLQPLLAELNQLYRQLGALDQEESRLTQQSQNLRYALEQIEVQRRRVREKIAEQESDTSRIYLATKSQTLLDAYKERITYKKVKQIESLLVKRFNQLCHKETFLDKVEINPQTFQVTLYRLGKVFSRQQLSAGENQLFAIATLWALREVSGRPMPVVIDTPLSRLDSEHRITMTQEFFPHTSHQLIVLATDVEIDDALYNRLEPAISHVYQMQYVPETGAITYTQERPVIQQALIPEGVVVS